MNKIISCGKYNFIIAPLEYPGIKYSNKYCLEHHYVYWKNTGIIPKKGIECIHHKNGKTKDNKFENLELIDWKEHIRLHKKTGRTTIKLICDMCKKKFIRERNNSYIIKKYKHSFCSRQCTYNFRKKEPITQPGHKSVGLLKKGKSLNTL